MIRTLALLALSLLALSMAPQPQRPYCASWFQARESEQGTLLLVPIVANRTALTRVEVWVHTPRGIPLSAHGWAQGAVDVPAGFGVFWTEHALSAGQHAVTMEVFEDGRLVDGWERKPNNCLTIVEVR